MGNGVDKDTGILIASGQDNVIDVLTSHDVDAGRDVVFGENARRNLVIAGRLYGGITNEARTPTNRVITANPIGYVAAPPIPPTGEYVTNRYPPPCWWVHRQEAEGDTYRLIRDFPDDRLKTKSHDYFP